MSTQVISTMSRPMSTPFLVFSWLCRIVAAVILLQTLFFKFTAAPESVYIFTKLGTFIHTYIPFASISTIEVPSAKVVFLICNVQAALARECRPSTMMRTTRDIEVMLRYSKESSHVD